MADIGKLKQLIQNSNSILLGNDSFILGTAAQQYDSKKVGFYARKILSFPVQTARVSEIARASFGEPTIAEFKESRISEWFIGRRPKSYYLERIENYINLGQKWGVIGVSPNEILLPQKFELDTLNACGDYLKGVYSTGFLRLKQPQMESLLLLRYIIEDLPTLKELEAAPLNMKLSEITTRLSFLESFGVVKVLNNGTLVPLIATEVHGEQVEQVLQDTLQHPVNRYIFELIRKMPGIRFSKLIKHIGIPTEDEASRIRILTGLSQLREGNLIAIFLDDFGSDVFLVPVWICYNLIRTSKPSSIDAFVLKKCFKMCSYFWDKVDDVSKIDVQIDTLRGILNELMRKKQFSAKELDELEPIYRIFLSKMRLIGLVKPTKEGGLEIEATNSNNLKILNTVLIILNSVYRAEVPSQTNEKIDDTILSELNNSIDEVFNVIREHLSIKDLKLYSHLKSE